MLLVSYQFLLFLAVLVVLYYVLPKQFQWGLLLLAGLLFYACAGAGGLVCLFVTVTSTRGLALSMEKRQKGDPGRKRLLILGLILNVGILAALKYTNFLLENVNAILIPRGYEYPYVNWLLPLGISYYTFQSVGYLIDVYRGKFGAERNFGHYALFFTCFPKLLRGPISR